MTAYELKNTAILNVKGVDYRCILWGNSKKTFRVIYSGVNGKWYRKSWKEFDELRDIDQKYYCSNYYDVNVNKYGVKCGTSLRFCKNNRWINGLIL